MSTIIREASRFLAIRKIKLALIDLLKVTYRLKKRTVTISKIKKLLEIIWKCTLNHLKIVKKRVLI